MAEMAVPAPSPHPWSQPGLLRHRPNVPWHLEPAILGILAQWTQTENRSGMQQARAPPQMPPLGTGMALPRPTEQRVGGSAVQQSLGWRAPMAGWPGIFVRPVTGPGVEPLPGTPARIWATTAREACVCGGAGLLLCPRPCLDGCPPGLKDVGSLSRLSWGKVLAWQLIKDFN